MKVNGQNNESIVLQVNLDQDLQINLDQDLEVKLDQDLEVNLDQDLEVQPSLFQNPLLVSAGCN